MKKLLDFYINSSIHVALAVVCLVGVTVVHFDLVPDWGLFFFIFFGTVSGYNFVKFAGVAGLHHRSLTRKLKLIQIFSGICFLGLILSALLIEFRLLLWAAFFGLFTLLYAIPVFGQGRNLRSIFGIKVFVICFVWAGVTVALPLINAGKAFDAHFLLEFFQRFFLVLVWILPFEIRDLRYDLKHLGTIPQRLGIRGTKILGYMVLIIVWLLGFLRPVFGTPDFLAASITVLVSGMLLWKARELQNRYYSALWVEAIPLLWLGLLLILGGM